ncbi:MAG: high frequency lysogenization protein HflD [Pseudomonadales bacterium]
MSVRDQTLCLAALMQHCQMVEQLANSGSVNYDELGDCLQQLFITDHETTQDAFGTLQSLTPGLQLLQKLLARNSVEGTQNLLQYAVSLLHLERKLSHNKDMLQIIRNRLDHASYHRDHFSSDNHGVAEQVAGIYQDTLSTLKYRIHVKGNMQHLQDEHTANCIRALLLCAVRSVRLWRLSGGSRLNLLLKRGQYQQQVTHLLAGKQ